MSNFASTLFSLLIIAAAARAQAQVPAAPVTAYPSDKAVNVLTATSLKWHKSDGATGYAVQVSTDAAFTMPMLDDSALTDTLDHVSHLADTTVYYWRVRALGAGGFGPYSKVHSFTTTPPLASGPNLIAQPDVTPLPLAPTLMWNTYAGVKTYAVQISTEYNFATLLISEASISDTAYTPKGLEPGAAYYWHVRANTSPVATAWSKGFFTTGGTSALAAPDRIESGDFRVMGLGGGRGAAVDFRLEKAAHVRISAFTLGGKSKILEESYMGAGMHRLSGLSVASGIWWIRMDAGAIVRTRSVLVP